MIPKTTMLRCKCVVHGAKQRENTPSSAAESGSLIILKMAPSGKVSWRLLTVNLLTTLKIDFSYQWDVQDVFESI